MLKDTLTPLYFATMEQMVSIEDQMIAHLPRMIERVHSEELSSALQEHLAETEKQKHRLEEIFSDHNYDPTGGQDEAFAKMIQEAESTIAEIADATVRDAYIIAVAQSAEHLEMAKYGTLVSWADVLEDDNAKDKLKETLGEEEHADKKLTKLAEGSFLHSSLNKAAVPE